MNAVTESVSINIVDLVNIFDPADKNQIGTVAEQEAEFEQWRERDRQLRA